MMGQPPPVPHHDASGREGSSKGKVEIMNMDADELEMGEMEQGATMMMMSDLSSSSEDISSHEGFVSV